MPRSVIALVAFAALVAPIALGVFALSPVFKDTAESFTTSDSLDATLVDHAVRAVAPPLVLTPPVNDETLADAGQALATNDLPVPDLAGMAAQDPEGAVALVRQALLDNPMILEEAIAALEQARTAAEEVQMVEVIEENADLLFSADHASVMGNPEGTITLVEFIDYNCHFCKRAHNDVLRLIEAHDDVRVVVKDFPVLGPGSLEAAQVAIAFRSLGGDMEAFIDAMMTEETAPADDALARQTALALGADEDALNLALEDPNLMEPVSVAYSLAEALGIRGTPAFVVGQERIVGAVGFDRLAEALQSERDRLAMQ